MKLRRGKQQTTDRGVAKVNDTTVEAQAREKKTRPRGETAAMEWKSSKEKRIRSEGLGKEKKKR